MISIDVVRAAQTARSASPFRRASLGASERVRKMDRPCARHSVVQIARNNPNYRTADPLSAPPRPAPTAVARPQHTAAAG